MICELNNEINTKTIIIQDKEKEIKTNENKVNFLEKTIND